MSLGTQEAVEADGVQKIAVFDFDGTCINGQSGSLFACYLFLRGYLKPLRALRLGWWGLRYELNLPCRQDEAREVVIEALGKFSADQVDQIMGEFHDKVLMKHYRPAALEEVARRKEEGCTTLLVSATFRSIAQRAAAHLGVDGYIATTMERDAQGEFTGRVEGSVVAGPEKTAVVRSWADEHIGAGKWDLAYAYGDHRTDIDLLSHARHAFAVRPDRSLRKEAVRQRWDILDWR